MVGNGSHRISCSWLVLSTCFTYYLVLPRNRSSLPEVFCKKGVLRNFTKFTGKHLYQSFFFNKVAGLRPPLAASVLVFEAYIAYLHTKAYILGLWRMIEKIIDVIEVFMNGLGFWLEACNLIKKEALHRCFLWILKII